MLKPYNLDIRMDILEILNKNCTPMTYMIRNILTAPYYEYLYDNKELTTSKVLYQLKKLETIGLVERIRGDGSPFSHNPYKRQLMWSLISMREIIKNN